MNTRAAYRSVMLGAAIAEATCPIRQTWPGRATPATTLPRMVDMVMSQYDLPAVVETATGIATRAPEKDQRAIAGELLSWLRVRVHFVPDPIDRQVLTAPTCMLKAINADGIVGADCVDVAMLAAALGRAVGLNVAFVAEGYDNGPRSVGRWMDTLSHVYAIAETPSGWVQLDTQQPIDAPNVSHARQRVTVSIP
jgi:hypothetical protein